MKSVDYRELIALRRGGAQIVEVLPAFEYRTTHIAGAIHLPLARVIVDASNRLASDRPIVVYCRDAL